MVTALRHAAPRGLTLSALVIAGLLFLPLGYVLYLALAAGIPVWIRLWTTRIPELLWNTVSLAAGVAVGTFVLGVTTAWLVVRYEFPGRRVLEWALVLPLAMPTYVLAYVYAYLLGFGGPVDQLWQRIAGPDSHIFPPQSWMGVTVVMTLDTFPFVYLLTRSALLNFNVSFEEVARACGVSWRTTLRRVTLPLIRPGIVAGLSLVLLYVVSDFGAVSLLRYQTLTYAVYQQVTSRYDHAAAGALSLLLVFFAFACFMAERWFRRRCRFYQTLGRYRTPSRKACGPFGGVIIAGFLVLLFLISFGIPAYLLIQWSLETLRNGALDVRFVEFTWNSVALSAVAATLAMVLGAPLAFLAARWPSRLTHVCLQSAYGGYVLPGPVAALALLVLFSHLAPFWYGTAAVLLAAYVIHFLPAGLQSMEPAILQVSPNLEEAARTLGVNLWHTFRRVTLPLVRGGFAVAWLLMFLQCMKELPATLMLRPVGFDTLAIRVWLEASEELYQLAAPPALLIVLMTLPALTLLIGRDWRSHRGGPRPDTV